MNIFIEKYIQKYIRANPTPIQALSHFV